MNKDSNDAAQRVRKILMFSFYLNAIFWKTNISYLLISTRTWAYQGVRNIVFFGNICVRTKWMIPNHLERQSVIELYAWWTHFKLVFHFCTPWKLRFSDVFRMKRNGTLASNGLTIFTFALDYVEAATHGCFLG